MKIPVNDFTRKYKSVINWIIESKEISLKYRVFKDLLEIDESDNNMIIIRKEINQSAPVNKILSKMHPDGYWLEKKYNGEWVGDGVEYGNSSSTHFCLAYLAELGLDRSNPLIEKAANRYLDLQSHDGDWFEHLSCLNGYNIRNFIMLGYRNDPRLQRTIDLCLKTERIDGGYLCDLHERTGKRFKKKSCIRGSAKVLLALAELPEYYDHPRTKTLVNYFLKRRGIFSMRNPDELANKDMGITSFPFTWGTNSWEILFALSKMGYGRDERLRDAWDRLEMSRNKDGIYILDYTSSKIPYKFGKRGDKNPWITFYILLAKKYMENK